MMADVRLPVRQALRGHPQAMLAMLAAALAAGMIWMGWRDEADRYALTLVSFMSGGAAGCVALVAVQWLARARARPAAESPLAVAAKVLQEPALLLRARRDARGRVVDFTVPYANHAARRLLGMNAQGARPRASELFLAVGRGPSLTERWAALVGGTEAYRGQLGIQRTAAEEPLVVQYKLLASGEDMLLSLRVMQRDSAAVRALARSRSRLRLLMERSPTLISCFDRRQRCRYANEAHAQVLGLAPAAMLGRPAREAFTPEIYAQLAPYLSAALEGGPAGVRAPVDVEVNTPLGTRHLEVFFVAERDRNGRIRGVFGILSDVTRATAAERSERENEQWLQSITASVPVMMAFIDCQYVFRFNSAAYSRWFNRPLSEITGRHLAQVIGEEGFRINRAAMEHAAAERRAVTIERHIPAETSPLGRELYAEVTFIPQFGGDGRLFGFCASVKDLTEARQNEQRLRQAASTDPLTGLPNRAAFNARLEAAVASAAAGAPPIWVGFWDLDDFKAINDGMGHAAGDALLQAFAQRVSTAMRRADMLARLGGDEFALLLQLADARDAGKIAQKIYAALEAPVEIEGRPVRIRACLGLAQYAPHDTAAGLLKRADAAVYEAKQAGKHRYAIAPLPSADDMQMICSAAGPTAPAAD